LSRFLEFLEQQGKRTRLTRSAKGGVVPYGSLPETANLSVYYARFAYGLRESSGSTLVSCLRMLRLVQVLLEGGLEQLVETDPMLEGILARPSRWSGVCPETGRSA
jgi:hypothetical protein